MSENQGVNPPNYSTLAGNVRLLVGDTDPIDLDPPVLGQGEYAWYSDIELEALGALHGGNPKRVAIWILSIVPLNQAMLLKKWTTDDLAVDGPSIIKGMENTLKRLAAEVAAEIVLAGEDEGFFVTGGYELPNPYLWNYYVPGVVVD